LIGPDRHSGSTESKTCHATHDAVFSWPDPLMAHRVLAEMAAARLADGQAALRVSLDAP
jgi:hypothetical protein